MNEIEELLIRHNYSDPEKGFYSKNSDQCQPTEADKVWSNLAQDNPIRAAAATPIDDPFAKYPKYVETAVRDEASLILDAGCGYGRVAIPLLRQKAGIKIVGIDASAVMLSYFLDLLAREELGGDMRRRLILVHSNINQLLFKESTFDYVYSCGVLLHNPYCDVETIIKEFHRVLRPNGKLILVGSFPNLYNLEGIQSYFYLKLKRVDEAIRNGPVRVYTKKRILGLFRQWSEINVVPTEAVLVPRQVGRFNLPFADTIRAVNRWVERVGFAFIARTSVLAKSLDVVAVK